MGIFDGDKGLVFGAKQIFKDTPIGAGIDTFEKATSWWSEPQRAYMWELSFSDPLSSGSVFGLKGFADSAIDSVTGALRGKANEAFDGTVGKIVNSTIGAAGNYLEETSDRFLVGGVAKNIRYQVKAVTIPMKSQEVIKKKYMGASYTYVGRSSAPNTIRASFWDNQSLDAYRYLTKWIEMMNFGDDKKKAHPMTYQRPITLRLLDVTNLFPTYTINFYDAFPVEITDAQLNYNESSEVMFDVIFQFRYSKVS